MRRWIAALSVTAPIAMSAGCQHQTYTDRQEVDAEPLVVDQAMQQRQWEPVTAYYENGMTRSASTGFAYTPNQSSPYAYSVTDTATFVVNFVTLPYTMFVQRNGVESGGVQLPPSYTAIPPVPPSTQPME